MASNLSSIGFQVKTKEQFGELAEAVAKSASQIKTKKGSYLHWCCDSGAELWLQINNRNELVGMNPHFAGTGVTRVGLISRIERPDDTELDGAFHGWADPEEGKPRDGIYPFVFDCPDATFSQGLSLPTIVETQIAAFARELTLYESDEAFNFSQNSEMKFAAESFIPSGLFSPGAESTDPPSAIAIFTGHILQAEVRINSMTKNNFWWVKVKTLGGIFDVVADPVLVASPVVAGGVLSGTFWLSGKICGRQTLEGRSFLRRLFGRK